MTKVQEILDSLLATICELSAVTCSTARRVNALLCYMRSRGLVRRTDRRGMGYGRAGPKPSIWERA